MTNVSVQLKVTIGAMMLCFMINLTINFDARKENSDWELSDTFTSLAIYIENCFEDRQERMNHTFHVNHMVFSVIGYLHGNYLHRKFACEQD